MTCNRMNNINQNVLINGTYNNTFQVVGTAKIKIINISNEKLIVVLDGFILNIKPYYIGDYMKVNAINNNIVVKKKDKTIINTDLLLDGGGIYTFIIINNGEYLLLDDDLQCPVDNLIRVRFVHVGHGFGSVDVMLNNHLFNNIMYMDSNVLEINEKQVKLQITPYDFNPIKLHFKHGGIYTIILINKDNMLSIMNVSSSFCY